MVDVGSKTIIAGSNPEKPKNISSSSIVQGKQGTISGGSSLNGKGSKFRGAENLASKEGNISTKVPSPIKPHGKSLTQGVLTAANGLLGTAARLTSGAAKKGLETASGFNNLIQGIFPGGLGAGGNIYPSGRKFDTQGGGLFGLTVGTLGSISNIPGLENAGKLANGIVQGLVNSNAIVGLITRTGVSLSVANAIGAIAGGILVAAPLYVGGAAAASLGVGGIVGGAGTGAAVIGAVAAGTLIASTSRPVVSIVGGSTTLQGASILESNASNV